MICTDQLQWSPQAKALTPECPDLTVAGHFQKPVQISALWQVSSPSADCTLSGRCTLFKGVRILPCGQRHCLVCTLGASGLFSFFFDPRPLQPFLASSTLRDVLLSLPVREAGAAGPSSSTGPFFFPAAYASSARREEPLFAPAASGPLRISLPFFCR